MPNHPASAIAVKMLAQELLDLELSVENKRSWIRRGQQLTVNARLKCKDSSISIPVSGFLQKMLKHCRSAIPSLGIFDSEFEAQKKPIFLKDHRGKPSVLMPEANKNISSPEEELFYSHGVLFEPGKNFDNYQDWEKNRSETPFTFTLLTSFHQFNGSQEIIHELRPHASSALSDIETYLSPAMISCLVPARLDRIRIGLEKFRPHFMGSMLGNAPVVSKQFYLDCSTSEISLYASDDQITKATKPSGNGWNVLLAFDRALKESNLCANFYEKFQVSIQ